MHELTPKEQQLFDFIESYQLEHGASPTLREMREAMNLKSDGFIVHCLQSLTKKKAIQKDDTPRGIKLLPAASDKLHADVVQIPVLGTIPAGTPVLSEENISHYVTMEKGALKNPEGCFILKVRGDSMINAGIFEGDYVIASSTAEPKPQDIVVALVDGESTVKRYIKERGRVALKAENPKYKTIYPESELQMQGVVKGMFRWY